eukprot:scaffold20312_cov185-Amphora_coffeaeformis.AAC.9
MILERIRILGSHAFPPRTIDLPSSQAVQANKSSAADYGTLGSKVLASNRVLVMLDQLQYVKDQD